MEFKSNKAMVLQFGGLKDEWTIGMGVDSKATREEQIKEYEVLKGTEM